MSISPSLVDIFSFKNFSVLRMHSIYRQNSNLFSQKVCYWRTTEYLTSPSTDTFTCQSKEIVFIFLSSYIQHTQTHICTNIHKISKYFFFLLSVHRMTKNTLANAYCWFTFALFGQRHADKGVSLSLCRAMKELAQINLTSEFTQIILTGA